MHHCTTLGVALSVHLEYEITWFKTVLKQPNVDAVKSFLFNLVKNIKLPNAQTSALKSIADMLNLSHYVYVTATWYLPLYFMGQSSEFTCIVMKI